MDRIPNWAIINTVLLSSPVVLGLGFVNLWFIPNKSMIAPAAIICIFYYWAVIKLGKKVAGVKSLRKANRNNCKTKRDYFILSIGFTMFFFFAFNSFYLTVPTYITSLLGGEIKKSYTVSAFYNPHQRYCDYKLVLEGASPAFTKGFCIASDIKLSQGSTIYLVGRESFLGFRFTKIES